MGYVLEWVELFFRWFHVVAGVAWIGTAFYFNWLNAHLVPPRRGEEGVAGELWAAHGGGFYRVLKYDVAPERMPRKLHMFKWEAYATWITGVALLVMIYYMRPEVYLLGPGSGIGSGAAIALGAGSLVLGWFLYDRLCRSPLLDRPVLFGTLALLLAAGAAWLFAQFFSGRGAYYHLGALLGTLMAANVFRVIIPAHRELVDALKEGREPDAEVGIHAAHRSLHNNYMTLPVLFIMISIHYPITYEHAWNWLILAALGLIGAVTRHHFNLRNRGEAKRWILPAAAVGMVALAFVSRPGGLLDRPDEPAVAVDEPVSFEEVQSVVGVHCAVCHAADPVHELFDAAPGGIRFETAAQIRNQADQIYETTVRTHFMPLGNLTDMTEEERALLGRWYRQEIGED